MSLDLVSNAISTCSPMCQYGDKMRTTTAKRTEFTGQWQGVEGNTKVKNNFEVTLKEQQINNIKDEIYDKFQMNVGASNGKFECYIPSDVLYKMNSDTELKDKVYKTLESYSSDSFNNTMQTLNPPVKKCTLIFDDEGSVVATLEADADRKTSSAITALTNAIKGNLSTNNLNGMLSGDAPGLYQNLGMYGLYGTQGLLGTYGLLGTGYGTGLSYSGIGDLIK